MNMDERDDLPAPTSIPKRDKRSRLSTKKTSVKAASNLSLNETLDEFQDQGKSYRRTAASAAPKPKSSNVRPTRATRSFNVSEDTVLHKHVDQLKENRRVAASDIGQARGSKCKAGQKCISCEQMIAKSEFMSHFKTCLNNASESSGHSRKADEKEPLDEEILSKKSTKVGGDVAGNHDQCVGEDMIFDTDVSRDILQIVKYSIERKLGIRQHQYILCQVCQDDLSDWSDQDRNRHVNMCIDTQDNQSSTSAVQPPSSDTKETHCPVCQSNISHLSVMQRSWHINDCLDKGSEPKVTNTRQRNATSSIASDPGVLGCPICGRSLKSQAARVNHIKRCGMKYNVPTTVILQNVREQHRSASSDDVSGSTNTVQPASSITTTTTATAVNAARLEEATQLALALSSSMHQETRRIDDKMSGSNCVDPVDASKGHDAFSILMTPKKPKPVSRGAKAKQKAKSVPELIQLMPYEKLERLEERLASVLLCQTDIFPPTPTLKPSQVACSTDSATPSTKESVKISTKNQLWPQTSLVDIDIVKDRHLFYVPPLTPAIAVSKPPAITLLQQLTPPQEPKFMVPTDNAANDKFRGSKPSSRNETLVASTQTALLLAALATENEQSFASNTTFCTSPSLNLSTSGGHSSSQTDSKSQEAGDIPIEQPSGFLILPQEGDNVKKNIPDCKASQVLCDLSAMIANPLASDLLLQCKADKNVPLHSFILATRSPCLYKRMHGQDSIDASEFEHSTVMVLLRYLYTGDIDLQDADAREVSILAQRWYLDDVVSSLGVECGDGLAVMGDEALASAAGADGFTLDAPNPLDLLWSSDEGDSETDTESESSDEEKDEDRLRSFIMKHSQGSQAMRAAEEHLCDTEILDQLLHTDDEQELTTDDDQVDPADDYIDKLTEDIQADNMTNSTLSDGHLSNDRFCMAGLTQSPARQMKRTCPVTSSLELDKKQQAFESVPSKKIDILGNVNPLKDMYDRGVTSDSLPEEENSHLDSHTDCEDTLLGVGDNRKENLYCLEVKPNQDIGSPSSSSCDLFEGSGSSDEDNGAPNVGVISPAISSQSKVRPSQITSKHSQDAVNSTVMCDPPVLPHYQGTPVQRSNDKNSMCSPEDGTPELFAYTYKRPRRSEEKLRKTSFNSPASQMNSVYESKSAQDYILSDCEIEGLSSPHVLDIKSDEQILKLEFDDENDGEDMEGTEEDRETRSSEHDASGDDNNVGESGVCVGVGLGNKQVTGEADDTDAATACHQSIKVSGQPGTDHHQLSPVASSKHVTRLSLDADDLLLSPNDQIWKYNSPKRPAASKPNVHAAFDNTGEGDDSPVFHSQRMPVKHHRSTQQVRRVLDLSTSGPMTSDGVIVLDEEDAGQINNAADISSTNVADPSVTLLSPPEHNTSSQGSTKRKRPDSSLGSDSSTVSRKRTKLYEDTPICEKSDSSQSHSESPITSTQGFILCQDVSFDSSGMSDSPQIRIPSNYEMSPVFHVKGNKSHQDTRSSELLSTSHSPEEGDSYSAKRVKTRGVGACQGRRRPAKDAQVSVMNSCPVSAARVVEEPYTEPDSIDLTQDESNDGRVTGDCDEVQPASQASSTHSIPSALTQDVWDGFDDAGPLPDKFEPVSTSCPSAETPDNIQDARMLNQSMGSQNVENQSLSESMLAYDPPTDMETDVSTLMNDSAIWAAENEPSQQRKSPEIIQAKKKIEWVPPSPFTPVPNFSMMPTPQVMNRLQEYGIRKLNKKKGVKVLQDAFLKLHQYETDTDCSFMAESPGSRPTSAAPLEATSSTASIAIHPKKKTAAKKQAKVRNKKTDIGNASGQYDDAETEDVSGSSVADLNSSASSLDSEMVECPEESMLMCEQLPATPPSSSQLNASPRNKEHKLLEKKRKILQYILGNKEMYLKVLHYEPMELDYIQSQLKEGGIIVGMQTLVDFLDDKSIQFTMRETRKEEKETKVTKRKGRRTKKVAPSQES